MYSHYVLVNDNNIKLKCDIKLEISLLNIECISGCKARKHTHRNIFANITNVVTFL